MYITNNWWIAILRFRRETTINISENETKKEETCFLSTNNERVKKLNTTLEFRISRVKLPVIDEININKSIVQLRICVYYEKLII